MRALQTEYGISGDVAAHCRTGFGLVYPGVHAMTTHSRIAAFLSTSALCIGLAAAPSAFAAGADAQANKGDSKTHAQHKHHKSDKASAKHAGAKSGTASSMGQSGTTPAK